MYDRGYLKHYGILGMHWGKRRVYTTKDIDGMAKKNEKLKAKLTKTIIKSEKNKEKIDVLTKKLEKRGGYLTSIGYTMVKNTGKNLSRKLHKGAKLDKKIVKIKEKIENNETLMKTALKDMPKDQIKLAKSIVNSALKDN